MLRDAFGFIYLLVLVILVSFAVWAALHFYGKNRQLPHYQTDLVKELIKNGPFEVSKTRPINASAPYPFLVAEFNQGLWVVEQNDGSLPLSEFLESSQAKTILLQVELSDTANLAELKSVLEQKDFWKKVIFISRADGVLQDLRELAPRWTFTSGDVLITRLLSLYSIGLGKLLDIPSDILYLSKHADLDQQELDGLSEIAHEQNKLVIFEQQDPPLSVEKVDILLVQ